MIRHRPSIATEMKHFRSRRRRKLKLLPERVRNYNLRQEHERLAANAALYDPPANPTPEDILIAREESALIDRALRKLPGRSERVVRLYYGLGDCEPHTLDQVGAVLGTCFERPRQILAKAYDKLRRPLKPLRGKYTSRWHTRQPIAPIEPQPPKQPWGTPIIIEMTAPHVLPRSRRPFDLEPEYAAVMRSVLAAMLSAQWRPR